jgi:hypothetical protein
MTEIPHAQPPEKNTYQDVDQVVLFQMGHRPNECSYFKFHDFSGRKKLQITITKVKKTPICTLLGHTWIVAVRMILVKTVANVSRDRVLPLTSPTTSSSNPWISARLGHWPKKCGNAFIASLFKRLTYSICSNNSSWAQRISNLILSKAQEADLVFPPGTENSSGTKWNWVVSNVKAKDARS